MTPTIDLSLLAATIVDEGEWLPVSMGVAAVGVLILLLRHRRSNRNERALAAGAMSLFFALTIGMMAFGHLLAVTTMLAMGTLEGSLVVLYAIGVALGAPSWWLARHAPRLVSEEHASDKAVALNIWLGATLLALGLPNLPLAAPALFNVAYLRSSRRIVARAVVALTVVVNAALSSDRSSSL